MLHRKKLIDQRRSHQKATIKVLKRDAMLSRHNTQKRLHILGMENQARSMDCLRLR